MVINEVRDVMLCDGRDEGYPPTAAGTSLLGKIEGG
jgi:hypothetical protein